MGRAQRNGELEGTPAISEVIGPVPVSQPGGGDLASHPDRIRWNARYAAGPAGSFAPHPAAVRALAMELPDGPVLELACGPSGSALLAAEAGRPVTAVDVSEVALALLEDEARRRRLGGLITLVQADLTSWCPPDDGYALVLCTGYWEYAAFAAGTGAVAAGGLLAWEAFTAEARRVRAGLRAQWCLGPGEPATLLPARFAVLSQEDIDGGSRGARRRLLARERAVRGASPLPGW
ncbi:MAG: class I SAM-dependent methyltransferase [Streptosporangiaceae bacterium]